MKPFGLESVQGSTWPNMSQGLAQLLMRILLS